MFNKILVAIDESDINNRIMDAVSNIATSNRSIVTLVNVNKEHVTSGLTYVPEDYLEGALDQLEQESMERIEKAKSKLPVTDEISVKMVPLKGDPAQQILDYAKEQEQDLIIMGSRGLSGIKEMMLGSVSHKVSQFSKCPVLIVH